MLKSIVSCILTGFLVVPCGRSHIVLTTSFKNLVLFYYYFLIISDFSASSIGSETEKVINNAHWMDGGVVVDGCCVVYKLVNNWLTKGRTWSN